MFSTQEVDTVLEKLRAAVLQRASTLDLSKAVTEAVREVLPAEADPQARLAALVEKIRADAAAARTEAAERDQRIRSMGDDMGVPASLRHMAVPSK